MYRTKTQWKNGRLLFLSKIWFEPFNIEYQDEGHSCFSCHRCASCCRGRQKVTECFSNDMCSKDMFSNDLCSFRFWFLLKVLSQERRWWFQRVSIDFVFIKSKELEFYERKILPVVFHSFLKHYWQWKDFEQQLFVNANFKTFLLNCVTEFHGEDHVESHRVLGR